MSELLTLMKNRRTRRKFSSQKVSLDLVQEAIQAFRWAPSGANRQPWKLILVADEKQKARIRELMEEGEQKFHPRAPRWMRQFFAEQGITPEKKFLSDAPYLLCVFGFKKAPYYKESLWLAVGWFLLALEERGLATVTYTPSRKHAVGELLSVPLEWDLQVILPIGYPAEDETIAERPRKPLQEILSVKSSSAPDSQKNPDEDSPG